MLNQHDQASDLRAKMNNGHVSEKDEVDILHLPPRSEKHRSNKKTKQKETTPSGKIHIWITRIIVVAFLGLLVFTVFYFSNGFDLNDELKKDAVKLIDIVR
ncbi:hypothetical protein ACSVDE_08265 [Pseudalkalibacillus sp. Hm43]|uniref:hypothetical protein n=1 Tax=Pseudalkalibacillus sp. Hm43 TaxID=3450742 RepID=UPI003F433AAA